MWPSEDVLRVALREEEDALRMARRVAALADSTDPATIEAELSAVRVHLGGEFEVHMEREESELFPPLAEAGKAEQVAESNRHHAELRLLRYELAQVPPTDGARLSPLLRALSAALVRHLRFEVDLLYPDTQKREVAQFRLRLEAACAALPPAGPMRIDRLGEPSTPQRDPGPGKRRPKRRPAGQGA
jgi:alkylhydroperoxidase family enzyme